MTTVVDHCRFQRTLGVLWRDTGMHVVVLTPGSDTEVVVLGGGGAVVWRMLEESRSLPDLQEALAAAGDAPDTPAIQDCLDDLVSRRLVTLTPDGETRP